jgi:NADPH-dependent 2,4-dienoyl-CoA reductase/sulfur reductase-like enzyme
MKSTDVLVIGSSAAGLVAAMTARSVNPDKRVVVVRREDKTLVPCGIPYVFGSVDSTDRDILPSNTMFDGAGIELVVDEVLSIDRMNKTCLLRSGNDIRYEKLVIGTGSIPHTPDWLEGTRLDGVFTVPKDKVYLDEMQERLEGCRRVVTIGAGFIGVELSDELVKAGHEVTLVEKLPSILRLAFDQDVAEQAQTLLAGRGVEIITGRGVARILGDERVNGVELEDGEVIAADAVVLTMGYRPNVALAQDAGLPISRMGFIEVDEYMRTEDPDIFAVGDCAEKRDFVTRKPCATMLASTACAEARTAGLNLFKLSVVKTFSGTISIFSTALGDTGFGVAGLTESRAREEGFDIVTGSFTGMDKHPGSLADTHEQTVKLVVGAESGVVLGGEVVGGASTGELTNIIGLIIQNRMDINTVLTTQIGTHPLLTASPAGYPLVKAAEQASRKVMNGLVSHA